MSRPARTGRHWRRAAAVTALLLAGEAVCRWGLGLGDPPRIVVHPRIEYLMAPGQDVRRFGHRVVANAWGMRSEPFSAVPAQGERRMLVFGDSIVHGGAQVDQHEVATSRIQAAFAARGMPVTVGNVSAASWGPANWRAYAEEYGFFGARTVILVLSSHDAADVPTFGPLDPRAYPQRRPVSALVEAVQVYGLDALHRPVEVPPVLPRVAQERRRSALGDLEAFIELARDGGSRRLAVVQHWSRTELRAGAPSPDAARIATLCTAMGIEPLSLAAALRQSIRQGVDPYRDELHLNAAGQRVLAQSILGALPDVPAAP